MVQRRFIAGSEWIYYKIYSGPKIIEQILICDLIPAVNSLRRKGLVDSFFFIRYMDPNYHIRLRLHCQSKDCGIIMDKMRKKLEKYVRDLTITTIQLDTYAREVERYGGDNIVFFERMFYYDSCLVSNCLKRLECLDTQRHDISLKFIDTLLDSRGLTLDDKIFFSDRNRKAYFQEIYQSNDSIRNMLNAKYRNVRKEVFDCLNKERQQTWWDKEISKYTKNVSSLGSFISTINGNELTSVIHMHVNRMYRMQQRRIEMLLYWYLYKYYVSQKAISHKSD